MDRIRRDIGVLLRLARDAWRQYFGGGERDTA